MSTQREERPNEILIFIVDESYGNESEYIDVSLYEDELGFTSAASEKYRQGLVAEFNADFEVVNVGPGFDVPAFVTAVSDNALPLIPWLMAIFFSGKPMVENVEAWRTVYARMKCFFGRSVVLNRQGAAVIAVEAVLDELGGLPKRITLKSYRRGLLDDEADFYVGDAEQIQDAPPTLDLALVMHVFEIEADSVTFVVEIDGAAAVVRRA